MAANGVPGPGGYDVQFVDKHEYKYMCVICHLVPRNVHQSNCCGVLMCEGCYEKQRMANYYNCPSCRRSMRDCVFLDRSRKQEILSLKVFCYNKHHGCSWMGELASLDKDHLQNCNFKLIVCDNCHEKVPNMLRGEHLANKCRKRSYQCPHCNKVGMYDDIEDKHLLECPECPIQCPNGCEEKIMRKETDDHRKTCTQQLVSCCYQRNGCNIMIKRKDKFRHELSCLRQHEPSIGHSIQPVRQNVLPINMCIDQFQSRRERKEMWEQNFFTYENGYFMCLKVFLSSCRSDHLSCYIYVRNGPNDDSLPWPFKGIFEIELLNQKEDRNHHTREIKFITSKPQVYNSRVHCDITMCPIGLGEPEYIAHTYLERSQPNCKYLENDKLLLRVNVKSAESCIKMWPCFSVR